MQEEETDNFYSMHSTRL